MIRRLRVVHRGVWTGLALLLPWLLWWVLAARHRWPEQTSPLPPGDPAATVEVGR